MATWLRLNIQLDDGNYRFTFYMKDSESYCANTIRDDLKHNYDFGQYPLDPMEKEGDWCVYYTKYGEQLKNAVIDDAWLVRDLDTLADYCINGIKKKKEIEKLGYPGKTINEMLANFLNDIAERISEGIQYELGTMDNCNGYAS